MNKKLKQKISKIKFLLFDIDGVLTDGLIIVGSNGTEFKNFDVKDGVGFSLAKYAGFSSGIISGRYSEVITRRAKELKIDCVYQDCILKAKAYEEIKVKYKLKDEHICFMGDDIIDLPVFAKCGLSVAPADAVPEVIKAADYVCQKNGGRGAARELVEMILKTQGAWDIVLKQYLRL